MPLPGLLPSQVPPGPKSSPSRYTVDHSATRHSPASSADSDILDYDTAPTSSTTLKHEDPLASFTFPRQAGTTVSNVRIEREPLVSPALSGFTFNIEQENGASQSQSHSNHQGHGNGYGYVNAHAPPPSLPLSPTRSQYSTALPSPDAKALAFEEPFATTRLLHAVSRPPTRDPTMAPDAMLNRSESASKRVQYFENAFSKSNSTKESVRERIQRDSPIIASLRTNVIIKDEYSAITSLSQHLSERYRRPESAIAITIQHSTCLIMGGSFEPAYVLDITAIPSELGPTTNKRNAFLIQSFVAEVLHVPSSRGMVRFLAIEDERLAIGGSTVLGDIERAEKDAMDSRKEEKVGLVRSLTSKSSRRSMVEKKPKGVERQRSDESEQHAIQRKFSSRSLRSMKSFKDRISPPIPTDMPVDLLPSPTSISGFSFTSKGGGLNRQPSLPKIHRLSPLHGIPNGSNSTNGTKSPDLKEIREPRDSPHAPPTPSQPLSPTSLSFNPTSIPSNTPILPPPLPPTPEKEKPGNEAQPLITSASRRPSMSASSQRPQSARKNLSNITGPADGIPSPPPIPMDDPMNDVGLSKKLSKRKSFVALFKRDGGVRT